MVGRWHILLKWFPIHGTCSCSEGVNTANYTATVPQSQVVYLNRCNFFLFRNKDKFNHLMIKSWPTFFHLCSGLPEIFAELRCLYVKKTPPCHHLNSSLSPLWYELPSMVAWNLPGRCGVLRSPLPAVPLPCCVSVAWSRAPWQAPWPRVWRRRWRRQQPKDRNYDEVGGPLPRGWVGKKPGLQANSTN